MKFNSKKLITSLLLSFVLAAIFSVVSFAAEDGVISSITYKANVADANTEISVQTARDGKNYLFLPASADLENLVLSFDAQSITVNSTEIKSGEAFDLTEICNAVNGEYTITVSDEKLVIMKSANIRSLFYVSDDPVNAGRPWVDAVKGNKSEGEMSLVGTDGEVDYTDKVTELKGRGNSTFTEYSKKPYQIKLKNKTALIEGSSDKSKKWVLLANAADYTLLHNSITFELAQRLEMEYINDYEAVDFYFDGEYRGHYLITEKVEVASNNVDIDDLDGMIEDLNADTDAYENPVVVTKTTASKGETDAATDSKGSYKFVKDLKEPELPDGCNHHAYLLELEFASRYPDEQSGFVTNMAQRVVTKNPEYLTKETGAFIAAFWQEFEDAVYSADGFNTKTGKYYYEYCDLESLVNLYLINELGKNWDGFGSSTFFYFSADSDIMLAGPVWDFDIGYGVGYRSRAVAANPENFLIAGRYLINGLVKIESFREAVKVALDPQTGKFYLAVQTLLGADGEIYRQSTQLMSSQKMNYKVWDVYAPDYFDNYLTDATRIVVREGKTENYSNALEFFESFIDARLEWLVSTVSMWEGDNYSLPFDSKPEETKELTFFEKIAAFFQSIIDWIMNLFK